jgi:hypothetical protein
MVLFEKFLKTYLNVPEGTYLEKNCVSLWDSHTDPRDRRSINEAFLSKKYKLHKNTGGRHRFKGWRFSCHLHSKWSSRELLQLKKLHRKGIKIMIWFANDEKETAAPYLKEGFDGYLPHDFGKRRIDQCY